VRYCVIIALILLSFYESNGQIKSYGLVNPYAKPNISFSDSVQLKNILGTNIILSNPLTKIGINGYGFDLYKSGIDNMIVMKPDSSNIVSTYIPNAIGMNNFYSRNPQLKIMLDSTSKAGK
jgi:hypothetical protein